MRGISDNSNLPGATDSSPGPPPLRPAPAVPGPPRAIAQSPYSTAPPPTSASLTTFTGGYPCARNASWNPSSVNFAPIFFR